MTTENDKTPTESAPMAAASPTADSPSVATPATEPVPPTGNDAADLPVSHPADGSKPEKRGLIGWLNFYAEDLLAPISKPGRRCERCQRKIWRGYILSEPTGVQGVSNMQIVCWRCKLTAAQQEMGRLRTTGKR
jgi:hypothetical protein